jgi:hypothetical protein
MQRGGIIDNVERLAALDVLALSNAEALCALGELRGVASWVEGRAAALRRQVRATAISPAAARADADHMFRSSRGSGARDERRADAAGRMPELQAALDDGVVTGEHVDAVATALADLNAAERPLLVAQATLVVDAARIMEPDSFRDFMRGLVNRLQADRGESLRARRKRSTRLGAWMDKHTGMWRLRGQLDPELGCVMAQQLEAALQRRLAMPQSEFCPDDPTQKIDFARAYALADVFEAAARGGGGAHGAGGAGPRTEVTIVVTVPPGTGVAADESSAVAATRRSDASPGWVCPPGVIDAGADMAVTPSFVTDLVGRGAARLFTVITSDGQVVAAPGRLNLGRVTRLANRAQRRALHALYATCVVPGCLVDYRQCHLHHVTWWRHGGRTDLDNLAPLCGAHHRAVHDEGWQLSLGLRREVTITRPDGAVRTTGPPGRGP